MNLVSKPGNSVQAYPPIAHTWRCHLYHHPICQVFFSFLTKADTINRNWQRTLQRRTVTSQHSQSLMGATTTAEDICNSNLDAHGITLNEDKLTVATTIGDPDHRQASPPIDVT